MAVVVVHACAASSVGLRLRREYFWGTRSMKRDSIISLTDDVDDDNDQDDDDDDGDSRGPATVSR
jgi:hypothetical protein